jgi:hypothetical protein
MLGYLLGNLAVHLFLLLSFFTQFKSFKISWLMVGGSMAPRTFLSALDCSCTYHPSFFFFFCFFETCFGSYPFSSILDNPTPTTSLSLSFLSKSNPGASCPLHLLLHSSLSCSFCSSSPPSHSSVSLYLCSIFFFSFKNNMINLKFNSQVFPLLSFILSLDWYLS